MYLHACRYRRHLSIYENDDLITLDFEPFFVRKKTSRGVGRVKEEIGVDDRVFKTGFFYLEATWGGMFDNVFIHESKGRTQAP